MSKIDLAPDVFIIEGFLSEAECMHYIQASEQHGYEEARVDVDGSQQMFKSIRNNMRIMFTDFELAESLWKRVEPHCIASVGISDAIGLNELFRYYKYLPGQRFKSHVDGMFQRNELEFSFYTLLIYLNDDFEGGETAFKDLMVQPKTGTALVFKHSIRHEGKPVLSGEKYVLRTDIMYRINKAL